MRFEANPSGRAFWPDRDDLSAELVRRLAAAQEGGSAIAECLMVANRIDFDDDESWHHEWKRIADLNHERGDAALRAGHVVTARSNWLRAIGYYESSAVLLDAADSAHRATVETLRRCAASFLAHRDPPGEVVSIPWPGAYPLQAYFLPPRGASRRVPTVVCIGEPGQRKEEYLYKMAGHAEARGLALLAVDLLGSGTGEAFDDVVGRPDLETVIGHVMDYLVQRDDVDADRVAVFGDGGSSSFVARGIAFDERFAAAVCDGGIWDLHERSFLQDRLATCGPALPLSRIARNIRCPVLIPAGERGWLKAERVRELYELLSSSGRDVTLKIFKSEETAAMQGHTDNPTLANEFIFDWIAARLRQTQI
jgi:dienelactone hydrolase